MDQKKRSDYINFDTRSLAPSSWLLFFTTWFQADNYIYIFRTYPTIQIIDLYDDRRHPHCRRYQTSDIVPPVHRYERTVGIYRVSMIFRFLEVEYLS